MPTEPDATGMLERLSGGEDHAAEQLLDVVDRELHDLADGSMRRERTDHTLQPAALVHEARRLDERQARVVEFRVFGGMSARETARMLDVSRRSVERDWKMGQAWLRREMSRGAAE